jgi:hypothetical protein
MKKLRDFHCANCGNIQEFMVSDHVRQVICNKCNIRDFSVSIGDLPKGPTFLYLAERLVSSPKVKGNTVGLSPSFSSRKNLV